MDDLHITVISPNRQHLDEMLKAIDDFVPASMIASIEAWLQDIGTPPDNKNVREVLMIDCGHGNLTDLEPVERLAQIYHEMVFILFCDKQTPEFLLRAMRAGVSEVLSFPVNRGAISEALGRIRSKHAQESAKNGKVLAFVSCKGGSGATFLACNLAYELATAEDAKVALFDLNLQFGDALLFLSNQGPKSTIADVAQDIHRLDRHLFLSSMVNVTPNLSVLAAPEDPSRAHDVTPEDIDALIKLARTLFDFIIIDVGRNLNALTLKVLDLSDTIYPIVQMTLPYIRDGKRLMDTFSHLDYPKNKIHLVVNRYNKGGDIQIHHIEQTLGIKVEHIIPNHFEAVASSVNQGIPIAKLAHRSPVSKALHEWGELLTQPPEKENQGWLTRTLRNMF
ncbi:MAG: CobQ/CobB/MinD/ParA nucleotide binding protein [Burkholderiaceae bacterium]|nr:CobQ/CobB/MinD/ParA nucleotide binding protein [Burkholderiaceae bacterium]